MRGDSSHYRIHGAFELGGVSIERVIKMCLVLFPSIWVSCNIGLLIVFVERRSSHSFMSVCPCFFFSVYWFPILCFHHALLCFGHPTCSQSVIDRMWVSLTLLIPFSVLTCHSLCAWQEVNAPCFLSFFQCPDLSLSLCSAEHECPFFFQCFEIYHPLCSTVGECLALSQFLSVH